MTLIMNKMYLEWVVLLGGHDDMKLHKPITQREKVVEHTNIKKLN